MKKIPYGIDDFEFIVRKDYYFIDKTRYIPTVEEQASYVMFVRPRRMGKSLFVNMLMSYYDINNKDRFDEIFGNLWIGKHPTEEANNFLVLKFDFSHVEYKSEELGERFTSYCMNCIKDFINRYPDYLSGEDKEYIMRQSNVKDAIVYLVKCCRNRGYDTYLFIDEYDNFSNTVLSSRGVNAHYEITHGEGFYRDFFKACKGTFTRIFMTGVAPVTYDDLTSGFNIADVVALEPGFDKVVGVTETELRDMIGYYRTEGAVSMDTDTIIENMRPWYNGFCFCDECYGIEPTIYNTDMVMRYMKCLVSRGVPPKEMLDHNAQTDTQKLDFLVMSEDLENRENRKQIVRDICAKGYTIGKVHEQFPASECGKEENFKSMLYYFGTLTFGGWNESGETILQVPNKTMGDLYLHYMLHVISNEGLNIYTEVNFLKESVKAAAINNEWNGFAEKLGELYSRYSSIRNTAGREADVNGFLRGILCLNPFFALWPELELGKGFCDILLVPKNEPRCPTRFSYLMELKFMKTGETDLNAYVAAACAQLDRYATDYRLVDSTLLRGTPLTKLYLIFQGSKLVKYGVSN